MKKGLGSIPQRLAWIDTDHPEEQSIESEKEEKQTNSSKNGLPYGWTRATFIIKEEYCKQLKALSYWERIPIKEIMDIMLKNFLKGKKIKGIPKKNGLL